MIANIRPNAGMRNCNIRDLAVENKVLSAELYQLRLQVVFLCAFENRPADLFFIVVISLNIGFLREF